ncbi:hypothetical protein FD789_24635, partial [Klebsiella pneumoniae]|nr:hypothetical protein [Klebsiella pneumoniae]
VRKSRTPGSVRGVSGNGYPYRDMILCVWFDYHILCAFPAAQIRKVAKSDLCNTHVFSPESNGRIPA